MLTAQTTPGTFNVMWQSTPESDGIIVYAVKWANAQTPAVAPAAPTTIPGLTSGTISGQPNTYIAIETLNPNSPNTKI